MNNSSMRHIWRPPRDLLQLLAGKLTSRGRARRQYQVMGIGRVLHHLHGIACGNLDTNLGQGGMRVAQQLGRYEVRAVR